MPARLSEDIADRALSRLGLRDDFIKALREAAPDVVDDAAIARIDELWAAYRSQFEGMESAEILAMRRQTLDALEQEIVDILKRLESDVAAGLDEIFQAAIDEADVMVNMTGSTLGRVAGTRDGRIKTQFETRRSGGLNDTAVRAEVEYLHFGYLPDEAIGRVTQVHDGVMASKWADEVADTARVIAKEERPVYGHVSDSRLVGYSSGVDQYGDVTLVLRREVRDRVTVTLDDSLAPSAHMFENLADEVIDGTRGTNQFAKPAVPSPIDSISVIDSATPSRLPGLRGAAQRAADDGITLREANIETAGPGLFWEAQIHRGMSLDDVREVLVNVDPLGRSTFGMRVTTELVDSVDRMFSSPSISRVVSRPVDAQRVGEVITDTMQGLGDELVAASRAGDVFDESRIDRLLDAAREKLTDKVKGIDGEAVEAIIDEVIRPAARVAVDEFDDLIVHTVGRFQMGYGSSDMLGGVMRLRAARPDITVRPMFGSLHPHQLDALDDIGKERLASAVAAGTEQTGQHVLQSVASRLESTGIALPTA